MAKRRRDAKAGRSKPTVNWLSAADRCVLRTLKKQFASELIEAFPDAKTINVCDCFQGYTKKQHVKIVLGVEVQMPERFHSHIVKLGVRSEVANDYEGWRKCIADRPFYSRIFVPVTMREVGDDRLAIIYENAYQFYGDDTDRHNPRELDEVVSWAILDDKPNPLSVQRVIGQIYRDSYRWFYHTAEDDPQKARRFFEKRLAEKTRKRGALLKWGADPMRQQLRRDVDWLVCGQNPPDSKESPHYLDPFHYMTWALRNRHVPQTLVGSSHGDLHGRNILVGVERGEAEYPAIYDYGEMDPDNALIWDFVKLETELKVRIIGGLCGNKAAQDVLLRVSGVPKHFRRFFEKETAVPVAEALDWKAKRELAFAFAFEHRLAQLTNEINVTAESSPQNWKLAEAAGAGSELERALLIFLFVRSEAAFWLGEKQSHRGGHNRWRDEYYFALALYGLSTAKHDYKRYETAFALISAGVATAQLVAERFVSETNRVSRKRRVLEPYAYQFPLREGHELWKKGDLRSLRRAARIFDNARKLFPTAVPVIREHALVLAAMGQHEEARKMLKPLVGLCRSFLDHETLSRIGRVYKDLADSAWESNPLPFGDLKWKESPARQWYAAGYEFYREAFDFSQHYFPGINAAFLAHFLLRTDADEQAKNLAREVGAICSALNLGELSEDESFWVLCTEGEAALISGDPNRAVNFYSDALSMLPSSKTGMVQSSYNQLCRLYKVIDKKTVTPVVDVFINSKFDLRTGPLGDCGYG